MKIIKEKQYDMIFTGSKDKVSQNSELYSQNVNVTDMIRAADFKSVSKYIKYKTQNDDPDNEYAEYEDAYTGGKWTLKRNLRTGEVTSSYLDR